MVKELGGIYLLVYNQIDKGALDGPPMWWANCRAGVPGRAPRPAKSLSG